MILDVQQTDIDRVKWTEVVSSQIKAVAWLDDDAATIFGLNAIDPDGDYWADGERPDDVSFLLVEFITRKDERSVLAYRGATREDFDLMTVPNGSAGRYMHASVKPSYPFIKLRVEAEDGDQDTSV